MANYVQRCGNISRLFSLGTTPNGNELWALELSAAPGKIEAKPNFKYLANMHGDEPVGRYPAIGRLTFRPLHSMPAP